MGEREEIEEANDTKFGSRKSEQYTKEINTSRGSASVITIYLSSMGVPPIEPVRGVGSKTWKGTGESIGGSVAVQSQKAHPWEAE